VRKRLVLDRAVSSWVDQALKAHSVELLPLDPEVAVEAANLSAMGGDPADHMIVATARSLRAPLVTADANIAESGMVEVIW
jgi:PIN domain nuclease of toxin-antitoxin system